MKDKDKPSENNEEEKEAKTQQKTGFTYAPQDKKQKEKSIEQEIMDKQIQQIESTRLERVFQILCNGKKTFNRDDVTRELFLLLEQSEPDQKLSKAKKQEMKHEIDLISENMIWEVDENLDKEVDKREFELMYKRCIFDKTGLEPKSLFYMVQFLMFTQKDKKRITIENTLELLYVNVTNYKLDSQLNDEVDLLFGKDAVEINEYGEETSITWKQYLEKVTKEAIDFRLKKEKEKKQCKPSEKNEDSQY